ncbi:MAG: class I SAM-dependent methyltransferase, partial [Myxococcales bacterium]|nr:class I SAM-dependent methyltransferase [Myxococcales bacterium]
MSASNARATVALVLRRTLPAKARAVIGGSRYTVIDRRTLEFHARIEPPHRFIPMDVTNADFADNSFDVILCNHTLPYIR